MTHFYDFALSYARDTRPVSLHLAGELQALGASVFHSDHCQSELLGQRLDRAFSWVFGTGCQFFVPFVSAQYVDRDWPQHEWSIAKREEAGRSAEFILPIRTDDSLLPGLPHTVAYLDLRELSVPAAASLLQHKLNRPSVPIGTPAEPMVWVACFGVTLDNLAVHRLAADLPNGLPALHDWLLTDLWARLAGIAPPGLQLTEHDGNGETFRARFRFDRTTNTPPPDFDDFAFWELLELRPYRAVYPDPND